MAEHPNVARIKDGDAGFAKGDFAALNDLFAEDLLWHAAGRNRSGESMEVNEAHVFHLHDGKVVESWNAPADQYAAAELIG